MNSHSSTGLDKPGKTATPVALKAAAVPLLDPADYASDMAAFDMSDEQEREFLETLWSIMRSFAEMGFTVDVCGQLFDDFNKATGPGVESARPNTTEKHAVQAGKESSS